MLNKINLFNTPSIDIFKITFNNCAAYVSEIEFLFHESLNITFIRVNYNLQDQYDMD